MVFASYNSASYLLPLDNDQSVAFYRNENRLFPAAIGPSSVAGAVVGGAVPPPGRSSSAAAAATTTTDMLTAAYHHEMQQQHHHLHHPQPIAGGGANGGGNMIAGDCPFGRVQSPVTQQYQQQQFATQHHHRFGGAVAMCDDFQPVGYLNGSSNGYYGFVPSLAPSPGAGGGGGGGGVGETTNNNNNNNDCHHPATPTSVNGHHHFHGNQRISCGEQNNNNNADTPAAGFYHLPPFPTSDAAQIPRKRKEANVHTTADEEMEFTSGQQHPKRRKTEPELNGVLYPFHGGISDDPVPAGRYLHQVEIHHPTVDEMECQEQPHTTFPTSSPTTTDTVQPGQPDAAAAAAASKKEERQC